MFNSKVCWVGKYVASNNWLGYSHCLSFIVTPGGNKSLLRVSRVILLPKAQKKIASK